MLKTSLKNSLLISMLMITSCASSTVLNHQTEQTKGMQTSSTCNEKPTSNEKHFIIGYGSLMQEKSRTRTTPNAKLAFPIAVKGYQRGWYTKGVPFGFSTTFLGIIEKKESNINAVIYEVDHEELLKTDKRESGYCRQSVDTSNVTLLSEDIDINSSNNIWVYASHPNKISIPNSKFPIVQSYVDIFVSGCLELEEKFKLKNFASQCLTTTHDWSANWINDRLYPRRPFIYQPKAIKIDKLLKEHLPSYFEKIIIE